MTLSELKTKLLADKPWPLYMLAQGAALKELAASTDPESVTILVDAVESGHRLASQIKRALAAVTDAPRADRMWEIWQKDRQPWLGKALKSVGLSHSGAFAVLALLKLGRAGEIASDRRAASTALSLLTDQDADVRAAVLAYAGALPNVAWANDELFDAWIRTQSPELERAIRGQKRSPSSVPKEALFLVAVGDMAGYHAIQDETGQIFREGFSLASDELRQRVTGVVTNSGDRRLIDAFTRALGGNRDTGTEIEARKTAGDEDGIVEAARGYGVFEVMDLCERWAGVDLRPADKSRLRVVERSVAAWREIGKISFEAPAKLPNGLVDFFDWWEGQKLGEKELAEGLAAPDPLVRAGSAWVSHRKAKMPPAQVEKMATSEDWPERLVARLVDAKYAAAPNEHVQWTSLAGGVISGALINATAAGTPAEHEALLQIHASCKGKTDRASQVNRGLAEILLAFQSHFQRGVIVATADDSAQDRTAVQASEAVDPADLEF